MGGLIETASGVIDRRLLASTFVPVLAFLAGLASVAAAGVGWAVTARWWSTTNAEIRVLLLLLVLTAALLLTQLLAAGRVDLIRLHEGYWEGLPLGDQLAEQLTRRHIALHRSLSETDPLWLLYPVGHDQVMPTTVGNILRGAEEHSAERYGINAVTAWPRLYPTLPETFRLTFAAAATDLELAVTMSALGVAFAALGGLLGVLLLPWPGTLLCMSAGALVAWLGYRRTVSCAESYGRLFRTAFDVHRWCLLDAMGLARPADIQTELDQWRALDKLWIRGSVDTDQAAALGYPQDTAQTMPPPDLPPATPEPAPPAPHSPPADRSPDREPEPAPGLPDAEPEPATGHAPPPGGIPQRGGGARRRRVGPTAVTLLALFLIACVVLAVDVRETPRHPTAARDLPPYHVISAADVHGPGTEDVRDRYTLRGISAGAALRPPDLGPRVRPGQLAGRAVIALGPPTARIHAPEGATGTTVTLVLVPEGAAARPVSVPGTLVLALQGAREHLSVVLSVPRDRLDRLIGLVAGSTIHLIVEGKGR
jgi:hypothetical protein